MTLGTHAVVGGAVATLVPSNPGMGFVLGFVSHFLLDSIPHWDYKLHSLEKNDKDNLDIDMKINRSFIRDLLAMGFDTLLGIAVAMAFFVFQVPVVAILAGIIGAVLPDFLQFLYFKTKREPLTSIQRFHLWIHADMHLRGRPFVGVASQVLLVVIVLVLFV